MSSLSTKYIDSFLFYLNLFKKLPIFVLCILDQPQLIWNLTITDTFFIVLDYLLCTVLLENLYLFPSLYMYPFTPSTLGKVHQYFLLYFFPHGNYLKLCFYYSLFKRMFIHLELLFLLGSLIMEFLFLNSLKYTFLQSKIYVQLHLLLISLTIKYLIIT